MSASRFELTEAAEWDLVEVGRFTRDRWGDVQCREYLTLLDRSFRLLASRPRLGKPSEVEGYVRYRRGKHHIFYEILADGSILIVRVLHERMLPSLHFR